MNDTLLGRLLKLACQLTVSGLIGLVLALVSRKAAWLMNQPSDLLLFVGFGIQALLWLGLVAAVGYAAVAMVAFGRWVMKEVLVDKAAVKEDA